MSEERLREYINDREYQEYKKTHTEYQEYERFCFSHRRDIENVLDELKELRAKLECVESLATFNMPNNIAMVCMFKADYERNKYEYETIDKYKSVLDEIREYIENNSLYEEEYDYDYEETMYLSGISDEKAKEDLLQILDKVKE